MVLDCLGKHKAVTTVFFLAKPKLDMLPLGVA